MKKYILLLAAAVIFAGCSSETEPPAFSETTAAQTSAVSEVSETSAETTAETSAAQPDMTSSSEEAVTTVSETAQETDADNVTTAADLSAAAQPEETEQTAVQLTEPAVTKAPEKETSQPETKVTYKDGAPRYNDAPIKDITMSETRRYVYTDDEGKDGCAPGEVIHYAAIPISDDMPERIELIDIDTDEHVGYMYDDGKTDVSGDETAGDGTYSIRIKYDLDIDTDPDVSETWGRCYFGLYTDSEGNDHSCTLPTFVNVVENITQKERDVWDVVSERINAVTSSAEYEAADVDGKEKMLLDELAKLADEGLVYEQLTRTNDSPRNVVFKVVKGPTMIVDLEDCSCGFGYDEEVCDELK